MNYEIKAKYYLWVVAGVTLVEERGVKGRSYIGRTVQIKVLVRS